MTAVAKKKEEIPIDVTWEDQQRICTFSRIHRRLQHLLKREQALRDDLEKMEDAGTEIMIIDEDLLEFEDDEVEEVVEEVVEENNKKNYKNNKKNNNNNMDKEEDSTLSRVKFVFGEAFVDVAVARCGELLDAEKVKLAAEKAAVAREGGELAAALEALKAQLYAKFGSQIYLEDQ